MSKNVMIPTDIFERVVELIDDFDVSGYGHNYRREYNEILRMLKEKMQRIDLRKAYARIITAEDEEASINARIEYLRQKRQLLTAAVDDDLPF